MFAPFVARCVVPGMLHVVLPYVVLLLAGDQSTIMRGSCAYVHLVVQRFVSEMRQEAQSLSPFSLQNVYILSCSMYCTLPCKFSGPSAQ